FGCPPCGVYSMVSPTTFHARGGSACSCVVATCREPILPLTLCALGVSVSIVPARLHRPCSEEREPIATALLSLVRYTALPYERNSYRPSSRSRKVRLRWSSTHSPARGTCTPSAATWCSAMYSSPFAL